MQINIEIAKYNDMDEMTPFQKLKFSSIDEAIANVEFLKLGYDYFKNGEILAVRADNSSRIHLIDHDSTVPLNELRKDLENKYTFSTQKDLDYDEIEFKITTKPEKKSLNSNFKFEKNENTKYAKTSTGENLPFKLFRTDDTGVRSNLLRESQNSGNSTDFALIERRFSENNSLQFFGTEKIQNHNDIAWLFKSLEDEAVEHAFLVYDFVDKGYFVQHISTGSYNAAIIDNKSIIGNIIEANPASVTLVHNHPSGNLVASPADAHILEKLKNALKSTDVKVNDGIIINLRSGNYLVFNEQNLSDLKHREDSFKTSIKVQSYSFSKQILVENFQPIQVKSPEEVAAYITSQKFGISDKTEMLILNSQLSIVGKFILPVNNQENSIIENVSKFGGSSCVLYGNNITPELIDFYSKRLEHSNITITDAILLKSENGQKMWESFIEEGKIEKNYNAKTDYFSENNKSNNTVMEENNLSWSDKYLTPKTDAYKNFVKDIEKTDKERVFNEKGDKFLKIYEYLESRKLRENKQEQRGFKYDISISVLDKNLTKTFHFQDLSRVMNDLKRRDFSENISLLFKDRSQNIEVSINNNAEKEKFLADSWAKEFSLKTDLSSGMTRTQIDEKQSYHYRNYETEAKKLGIEITPLNEIGEKHMDIQNKGEISNYKNSIDPDSNPLLSYGRDSDFIDDIFDDIENGVGDLWEKKTKDEVVGKTAFHDSGEVMEYKSSESYLKDLQKEIDHNMGGFTYETITKDPEVRKKADDLIYGAYGEDNPNSLGYYQNKGVVGGKIKDIAAEAIRNPESIKQYDSQTQNVINLYINQNPNIMESPQKEFDLALHLKTQLKYLGFGEGEKLHKDLEKGLNSQEKQFSIITSSDKALPGNKIDYAINFNKSENGGVFLNSYDATLNNSKGETVSQNFKIGKDNSFTAKEALNLLEGRSVKIEFTNPKTDQKETSFVQLNLAEKKNEYGNYNFQSFHQNYGVDTEKIVEKSNIIFDKPEYKDNTIKNLEKGNIVNVKFEMKENVIEGKAVLNPQYKNLSLYDNEMNRVNTNEPIKGLENDQKHEKSNVREQSISRGI